MNLAKLFPGLLATTPQNAAWAVLSQTRQTTNNQLHQGRFPLPVTILGGKRMVLIEDLQQFIDNARQQPSKRKVGRPTKASVMLAKKGGD